MDLGYKFTQCLAAIFVVSYCNLGELTLQDTKVRIKLHNVKVNFHNTNR